jgi:rhodanese-related sulfurtransferase
MNIADIFAMLRLVTNALFKEPVRKGTIYCKLGFYIKKIKMNSLAWNGHYCRHIKPIQLKKRIIRGSDFVLLDIRSRKAFCEGHIEGAINIPIGELLKAEEIPLDRQAEIIVACYFGISSIAVIDILAEQGYKNLTNMDGGMGAWHYEKKRTSKAEKSI